MKYEFEDVEYEAEDQIVGKSIFLSGYQRGFSQGK
jgi:hypothetical protein